WKFDVTLQLNGPSRLPDTQKMPEALRRPSSSPVYPQLLGQVTRKFKYFEVYIGGENLTNFKQEDPITEYDRPYHTHFDTSMVWGPIVGATVYGGLRYSIK
ncbi:MAG TPA: TonB-dependent receptor, partial [Bacteroidales bacterium]|nr:TonB-dependent receptor [Bacteroidales bacterium]